MIFFSWISSVVILQFLTLHMKIWFAMFWRTWSQVRGQDWPTCAGLAHGQWLQPQSFSTCWVISWMLNYPKYWKSAVLVRDTFNAQVPHCLKVFKIKQGLGWGWGAKWALHGFWKNFGFVWKGLIFLCKQALFLLWYIFICIRGVEVLTCLQIWCIIMKIWVKNDCVYILQHFPSHVFFLPPPPPPWPPQFSPTFPSLFYEDRSVFFTLHTLAPI